MCGATAANVPLYRERFADFLAERRAERCARGLWRDFVRVRAATGSYAAHCLALCAAKAFHGSFGADRLAADRDGDRLADRLADGPPPKPNLMLSHSTPSDRPVASMSTRFAGHPLMILILRALVTPPQTVFPGVDVRPSEQKTGRAHPNRLPE